MNTLKTKDIYEFITESNAIEDEFSNEAFADSVLAWRQIMQFDLLTIENILVLHRILMHTVRPDIAGKYRTVDVSIGGKIKKYQSTAEFENQLTDIINSITSSFKLETDEDRIKACKDAHIAFENVHPFEDGNGRTGRMIYNWQRVRLGLPLDIIHRGDEQYAYYAWFR